MSLISRLKTALAGGIAGTANHDLTIYAQRPDCDLEALLAEYQRTQDVSRAHGKALEDAKAEYYEWADATVAAQRDSDMPGSGPVTRPELTDKDSPYVKAVESRRNDARELGAPKGPDGNYPPFNAYVNDRLNALQTIIGLRYQKEGVPQRIQAPLMKSLTDALNEKRRLIEISKRFQREEYRPSMGNRLLSDAEGEKLEAKRIEIKRLLDENQEDIEKARKAFNRVALTAPAYY